MTMEEARFLFVHVWIPSKIKTAMPIAIVQYHFDAATVDDEWRGDVFKRTFWLSWHFVFHLGSNPPFYSLEWKFDLSDHLSVRRLSVPPSVWMNEWISVLPCVKSPFSKSPDILIKRSKSSNNPTKPGGKTLNIGNNFVLYEIETSYFAHLLKLMEPFLITPRSMTLWPLPWPLYSK